uniref:Uncharacterized protein n=2 Tax=Cajanus cajan TaxID=3821 RepID=A0A151R2B8_CAJCA|nr:hypothetical protein KK1_042224 [Cajanus cajan]
MTYLQVKWTLVPVIVVVESCWGLEPLRRSTRLIKGMKGVALSSMIFYGFFTWAMVFMCLFYVTKDSDGDNWFSVVFNWVYVVCQSWATASVIMPSNLAVNTVLYIYCKANHGEIVEEFGKDYVSLPFHDGNVSHAV